MFSSTPARRRRRGHSAVNREDEGGEKRGGVRRRGKTSGSGEDPDTSLNCRLKVGNYPVIIQR